MLYQNRVTGGLVEVISQHGAGILMCVDANEEVLATSGGDHGEDEERRAFDGRS
jgi:hypothetical protein